MKLLNFFSCCWIHSITCRIPKMMKIDSGNWLLTSWIEEMTRIRRQYVTPFLLSCYFFFLFLSVYLAGNEAKKWSQKTNFLCSVKFWREEERREGPITILWPKYWGAYFISNDDGDINDEVALLQTFSRLLHLVQFVKCWQFVVELNSKSDFRRLIEVVVLCSRSILHKTWN